MKWFLLLLTSSLVLAEIRYCGYSEVRPEYVVGGHDSVKDAWPWQVGIFYEGSSYMCGGSVLTKDWILTAAHCINHDINIKYLNVVAGDYNSVDLDGDEQKRSVSHLILHPGWNMCTLNNDVALIRISEPLTFSKHISPICLPKPNEHVAIGSLCYITGWGLTHPGARHPSQHTPPDILQQTRVPIVSRNQCAKLNTRQFKHPITKEMVCAGYGPKRSDIICHGDSGGPLACQDKNGTWILQGITSWGPDLCYSKEGYSVFARISRFVDWIKKVTSKQLS